MRVLVDTNVFISYLLDPKKDEKLQYVIRAGFEERFTIVLPQGVFEEIKRTLTQKPYLKQHIPQAAGEQFIIALSLVVELIHPIKEPLPELVRDKKDDFLLAYAIVGECDYLVTGDEDLQVLKQAGNLKIVSPARFYEILKRKRK